MGGWGLAVSLWFRSLTAEVPPFGLAWIIQANKGQVLTHTVLFMTFVKINDCYEHKKCGALYGEK